MQSGKRNEKNWLLEFDTLSTGISPLMGWESSKDTMSEVKLKFSTKEQAVNYAKKYNIEIKQVISDENSNSNIEQEAFTGSGKLINSQDFNGLNSHDEASSKIIEKLIEII